jgi:hypothetical protein
LHLRDNDIERKAFRTIYHGLDSKGDKFLTKSQNGFPEFVIPLIGIASIFYNRKPPNFHITTSETVKITLLPLSERAAIKLQLPFHYTIWLKPGISHTSQTLHFFHLKNEYIY